MKDTIIINSDKHLSPKTESKIFACFGKADVRVSEVHKFYDIAKKEDVCGMTIEVCYKKKKRRKK